MPGDIDVPHGARQVVVAQKEIGRAQGCNAEPTRGSAEARTGRKVACSQVTGVKQVLGFRIFWSTENYRAYHIHLDIFKSNGSLLPL